MLGSCFAKKMGGRVKPGHDGADGDTPGASPLTF